MGCTPFHSLYSLCANSNKLKSAASLVIGYYYCRKLVCFPLDSHFPKELSNSLSDLKKFHNQVHKHAFIEHQMLHRHKAKGGIPPSLVRKYCPQWPICRVFRFALVIGILCFNCFSAPRHSLHCIGATEILLRWCAL